MATEVNINNWNRKEHFEFFNTFADPFWGITFPVDVTEAREYSKANAISFFSTYLHACMKAINSIDNFKYRIEGDRVFKHDVINASATILRPDHTFGFSFIDYDEDLKVFDKNVKKEKDRILSSKTLFPPVNTQDCVYCSALPWVNFKGHKEPFHGKKDSVPRLAFSQANNNQGKLTMNVAITVNHALIDGYHVGLFKEKFQKRLNSLE